MDPPPLEGSLPVLAALEAGARQVQAVYLQAGKEIRDSARIRAAARQRHLEIKVVPGPELDTLAQGHSHGGVLALAGPRTYLRLDQLASGQPNAFVAMLYGVEDPYNYGQAIRALYAAGAHGLVAPERNWDNALSVIARAPAGAPLPWPPATCTSPSPTAAPSTLTWT